MLLLHSNVSLTSVTSCLVRSLCSSFALIKKNEKLVLCSTVWWTEDKALNRYEISKMELINTLCLVYLASCLKSKCKLAGDRLQRDTRGTR